MAGNKTRDGIKISKLVKALESIPGVSVEAGSRHDYKAEAPCMRPCPIDPSTHVKYMVVPWIKSFTGYQDSNEIYQSLRKGKWEVATQLAEVA